jgi:PAS domain S-box-containing protein
MLIIIGFLYLILRINDFFIKKGTPSKIKFFMYSILASILATITMSRPFTHDDMSIDLRSVPIFTISYLFGPKLGLVCCVLPILFRLSMGGPLAFKGIFLGIVSPMIIGSLFHHTEKTGFASRNIKIQRILFSFFIYSIVRAVLMFLFVSLSYILWFRLVISMTTFSLLAIYCGILLINDYTKKTLFIEDIQKKQQRIESLVAKLQHTNNTLHTLIDAMPAGIVVADANSHIILANAAAKTIINDIKINEPYVPEGDYILYEMNGRILPFSEIPLFRSLQKGEFITDLEVLLRYSDSTEKFILNASTPVYDNYGQMINAITVFQDISHIKKVEKNLHKEKKITEAFLNSITEILLLLDTKGTIIALNESCVQELGLKTKDLIGTCIYDFLPSTKLQSLKTKGLDVIKSKKSIHFEEEILDKTLDISLYPILDDHKNTEKITVFCKDITHLKGAEKIKKQFIEELSIEREKLKENNRKLKLVSKQHLSTLEKLYKKNEQLNIANASKNKFIANISHELKTPLNITMTYIEYLLEEDDGPLNAVQKEFLQTAYNNAERLQYLLNDLLDLSLLDTMTIKFNYENINITNFIKTITKDRELLLNNIPLNIHTTIPNKDIFIMVDPLRLRQVIDNLLDNAIKFSHEGTIRIILKEEKSHIDIQINDCGIGIPSDKINDIFNPFYQIDDSSKKKYKGVGLGLSIAKKIINAFGGDISVISNVDKGSCFKITIPFNYLRKEDIHEKNIYY